MQSGILIPLALEPSTYLLGPMGDSDPINFNNSDTERIPFKNSSFDPAHCNQVFRSWPTPLTGWKGWFKRMSASKHIVATRDKADISHCMKHSLSGIEKNKPLLQAASYFWSDTINAFLFNQCPLSPSLADVYMTTGLNITYPDNSSFLNVKATHKLTHKGISSCGG